jgi:CubicO group peptidase (beta-lactamase class C family)
MIARLVQAGLLSYRSTIGEIFPELHGKILPIYDTVTLEMLLEHKAGLWHDWPEKYSRTTFDQYKGTLRYQRLQFLSTLLANAPEYSPGNTYSYSNTGYVIAAAMAERAANQEYETLLDSLILKPLGISTAGWGLMNTRGLVDNTWEHEDIGGKIVPVDNILVADNPALDNPAGRLHMSLEDWSKFIRVFFWGPSILPGVTIARLEDGLPAQPKGATGYLDGWSIMRRSWAGGLALNHTGSNGLNFANVWIAPGKHFAVLVTANRGRDKAAGAAEELVGMAIHM